MTTDKSLYHLVSVGYVAENKLRTSTEIEVSLVELTPLVNGELKSDRTVETITGKDNRGGNWSVTCNLSNTITATWRGDNSNRVTAPDVRRGDKVEIYQYADTDKYYWTLATTGEANARKLETVVHAYSNTRDETDNVPSENNSWLSEVNTHEKHATFKTNKSDGEKFAYTLQINAADGNVVIADDAGNYIQMNSADQHITLETSSGGRIEIIKEDVIINCKKYVLNATESITTNTKTATHNNDTVNYKGDAFNLNMDSLNYTSNTYKIQSKTVKISGGSLTHNGTNVGNTHFHIGNQGKPTSPAR